MTYTRSFTNAELNALPVGARIKEHPHAGCSYEHIYTKRGRDDWAREDEVADSWHNDRISDCISPNAFELLDVSSPDKEPTLAEFKAEVVKVAREYATTHGWCEVVEEALGKLGLIEKLDPFNVGDTFADWSTARARLALTPGALVLSDLGRVWTVGVRGESLELTHPSQPGGYGLDGLYRVVHIHESSR